MYILFSQRIVSICSEWGSFLFVLFPTAPQVQRIDLFILPSSEHIVIICTRPLSCLNLFYFSLFQFLLLLLVSKFKPSCQLFLNILGTTIFRILWRDVLLYILLVRGSYKIFGRHDRCRCCEFSSICSLRTWGFV
jgi:hypothetical protein